MLLKNSAHTVDANLQKHNLGVAPETLRRWRSKTDATVAAETKLIWPDSTYARHVS